MPINQYNPVLNGIGAAYDIANRIRTAQREQEQFERLKKQDQIQAEERAYERKRQEHADSLNEATLRMKMLKGGIRQATPTDLAESTAERFRMDEGGNLTPTGQVGTSIVNQMFDYGGKKFVMPSEQEQQEQSNYQAKIAEGIAAAKAGAETRAKFNATAGTAPPSATERLGVAPGTLFSKETLDKIYENLLKPSDEGAPHYETDDSGNVYRIGRKGAPQPIGRVGKSKTPPAGRETTAYQLAQIERNARRDRRQELVDLEAREDKAARSVTALRTKVLQEKDTKVKAAYAAQLARAETALKRIRQEKVAAGFTTAEDAGLTGTASLPDPLGVR